MKSSITDSSKVLTESSFDMDYLVESGKNLVIDFGTRLLIAAAILVVGLWVIRIIRKSITRALQKQQVDEGLKSFLSSIISIVLKIGLFIAVLTRLGIEMTSFVALLAAAGLAIGLALSGTLQNFAGGAMILLIRPFKVGDFITAQGHSGTVNAIQIFHTVLKTPDNKTIIIPNGSLSTGSLINYSTEATRRVDFTFGIGYDDDIDKARAVLQKLISEDERIFTEPEPAIVISDLADSSVNFAVKVWCNADDYWAIFFDLQEKVKKQFDVENIGIPYPQMDVHVQQNQ